MKLDILNIEGKKTGKDAVLADEVFALEMPSQQAIYQDVRQTMANARQGTHKVKERGEVSGSKKKPYRQKGTGSARSGHKRSPLWRHGGIIFGPRPRSYSFKLNKKVKRLAKKSALTLKATDNSIMVLENFNLEAPRTKEFNRILANLELNNAKVLMLTDGLNHNVHLSSRNLRSTTVMPANQVSTYDILNADAVVIIDEALQALESNLIGGEK